MVFYEIHKVHVQNFFFDKELLYLIKKHKIYLRMLVIHKLMINNYLVFMY